MFGFGTRNALHTCEPVAIVGVSIAPALRSRVSSSSSHSRCAGVSWSGPRLEQRWKREGGRPERHWMRAPSLMIRSTWREAPMASQAEMFERS